MMKFRTLAAIIFLVILFDRENLSANKNLSPWQLLINKQGVRVDFIFYSKGDNYNNGVVIKISNMNDYSVNFNFTLIFRSGTYEKPETVSGLLLPGEAKTGSEEGLFYIPFKDGRSISEIGISDFSVDHIKNIAQ